MIKRNAKDELQLYVGQDKLDVKFSKIAKKIKRQRRFTICILIFLIMIGTLFCINYSESGNRNKPLIVFGNEFINYEGGVCKVYYSLGFKQVFYQSQYGKNYYERLWLWENIDKKVEVLTKNQYDELMIQILNHYHKDSEIKNYLNSFEAFNATILDIEKTNEELTIYMLGQFNKYVEYEDEIYSIKENNENVKSFTNFEDLRGKPMIATITTENASIKLKSIWKYEREEYNEYGKILYDKFPKAVARMLLTSDYLFDVLSNKAKQKNQIEAAAYFGEALVEDKSLIFQISTKKLDIYKVLFNHYNSEDDCWWIEYEELLKTSTLKRLEG